jgi:lipopolysaccharide export system protein LptC
VLYCLSRAEKPGEQASCRGGHNFAMPVGHRYGIQGGAIRVDHGVGMSAPAGRSAQAASRAYRRARRHSVVVRFFRFAIPVSAALAIGAVAVIAIFDPFGKMSGLSLGPVSLSGTKLTMEKPKLTGYRKDNRGYEMTATAAFQDIRKPTVVELKEIRGRMTLDEAGTLAHLEAVFGIFDSQKEHLELQQEIYVRTDNKQQAWLRSAKIDFKAGTLSSKEPVKVSMPGTTIEAAGVDILDNGKVITFVSAPGQRVTTVLENGAVLPTTSPEKKSPLAAAAPARTSQIEATSLRQ